MNSLLLGHPVDKHKHNSEWIEKIEAVYNSVTVFSSCATVKEPRTVKEDAMFHRTQIIERRWLKSQELEVNKK